MQGYTFSSANSQAAKQFIQEEWEGVTKATMSTFSVNHQSCDLFANSVIPHSSIGGGETEAHCPNFSGVDIHRAQSPRSFSQASVMVPYILPDPREL